MKSVVVFQPLFKFSMFAIVVSHAMTSGKSQIFRFLLGQQKGIDFQSKGGQTTLQ